ncbi:MAG: phage protein Gp27 family protein [Burkholderiaceae bacterium]
MSKIAQMPAEIREWLHKAFVARGFGDIEAITEEVNGLMKEAGVAITIGKSAVGAESQKVKRAQEAIRATTEAARLINEASPDAGDNRSAGAMAIVQSEVFEILLKMRESAEADDTVRLANMSEAALLLSRLSRSRVYQSRWNVEVEARAKAAADQVGKLLKKGGLDAKTSAEIRRSILGIVKREPAPTPAAA